MVMRPCCLWVMEMTSSEPGSPEVVTRAWRSRPKGCEIDQGHGGKGGGKWQAGKLILQRLPVPSMAAAPARPAKVPAVT